MKSATIALLGNPNAGKTTLFNALTGLRQQIGNYPGVTVERKSGEATLGDRTMTLIDLPGTYSLAALSPDEMIAVDLLLGQQSGASPVDGIIAIVDASNLQRNLYLVSQLLEFHLPIVVALNMCDVAERKGVTIDAAALQQRLGVPVIPMCANTGSGLDRLREAVAAMTISHSRTCGVEGEAPRALPVEGATRAPCNGPQFPPAFQAALAQLTEELQPLAAQLGRTISGVEAQRILIDTNGYAAERLIKQAPQFGVRLTALRQTAATNGSLAGIEAAARYQWIRAALHDVVRHPAHPKKTWSDRADRILTHKVFGTAIFLLVTALVFQSIYSWAAPIQDGIDGILSILGNGIGSLLPAGALRSLIVDGLIKGVGSVLAFLPQIALLFFFIALLEDCGYMARAAFLMDKLFARIGLSGKSFIPLLSSFACAIPGIMAARTIENRRDRLATILVAPLMSCSARLPVYTIMIAAFIPGTTWLGGWLGLQGLTLFAMHMLGLGIAIPVVWILKRSMLKGSTPPFVMELPSYKRPSLRLVAFRVYDRGRAFVRRAGTIIAAMTIVVWALSYFPHTTNTDAIALETSYIGRMGNFIEPAFTPLGWDGRIAMAAIASFPAREVVVASLGTIFHVADVEQSSKGLETALQGSRWPDGRPLFNIPVALSLMVFFALCCQCGATVAMIRRETNSWGYAGFAFGYMTALAYGAAWVTYQGAAWWGW